MAKQLLRPFLKSGVHYNQSSGQTAYHADLAFSTPKDFSMPKTMWVAMQIGWAIFVALALLSISLPANAQALPESNDTATTLQLPPIDKTYKVFLPVMVMAQLPIGEVDRPVDPPKPEGCQLNANEAAIANLLVTDSNQHRPQLHCDPILARVARERAEDMGKRGYFSHKTPDGLGPNDLVRAAGFVLPDWYDASRGANNIESIAAGYGDPGAAWDAWMKSSHHREHLLAEDKFWTEQVEYGIGYVHIDGSPYGNYWVVLTAPTPPK